MSNTNQITRIAIVALLVIGCIYVLRPFMGAVLFATIWCLFTWPAYHRLWLYLSRRDALAAIIMTLLSSFTLILPMAYLAINLTDSASKLFDEIGVFLQNLQPSAPDWVRNIPIIGEQISSSWLNATASHEELMKLIQHFYEPMRTLSLNAVQLVAGGFLQLLLVVFVSFFLYRDGEILAKGIMVIVRRLGGELGEEMLELSCKTVKSVMIGVFGTALAQAAVAFLGFFVAGAPAPFLLALATFFLSVIPVGPPLIWGGASLWLYNHGDHGWAIFIALYGLLAISTVDNIIKPILISHSSRLPLLLIVLGVLGGAVAFGFIGIFLGPTLLAVGLTLISHWVTRNNSEFQERL